MQQGIRIVSGCLAVWLSVCLSTCLPACLPACLPTCLSVRLPVRFSPFLPASLPPYLPASLPIFLHMCIYGSIFLSIYKCKYFYLSLFLFLLQSDYNLIKGLSGPEPDHAVEDIDWILSEFFLQLAYFRYLNLFRSCTKFLSSKVTAMQGE